MPRNIERVEKPCQDENNCQEENNCIIPAQRPQQRSADVAAECGAGSRATNIGSRTTIASAGQRQEDENNCIIPLRDPSDATRDGQTRPSNPWNRLTMLSKRQGRHDDVPARRSLPTRPSTQLWTLRGLYLAARSLRSVREIARTIALSEPEHRVSRSHGCPHHGKEAKTSNSRDTGGAALKLESPI